MSAYQDNITPYAIPTLEKNLIHPTDFIRALLQTFDMSAIDNFRAFLRNNPQVTKWQIAADFCLHDKERPNNTFAFTIIPYDAYPEVLKAEIKIALPKDLKKTKLIQDAAAVFLSHPRRFHFGFVFQGSPEVFNNGAGSIPLHVARESLNQTISQMLNMGRSDENIRRLKMLRQKADAKSFNVALLADMYVLSYLFCFVTLILARERPIEIVGWFSDRDKMTTWCDGVLWDISRENLRGLAEQLGIPIPKGMPLIALPDEEADEDENAMWFDEFIRLPDYIAGILAAWDLSTNLLPEGKEKYVQLAKDVVADAKNMAVLKIRYDDAVQCSRIVFSTEAT